MFPIRDLVVLLGVIIVLAEHVADDLEGLGSSVLHHELLHLVLATLHHRVQALGSSTAAIMTHMSLLLSLSPAQKLDCEIYLGQSLSSQAQVTLLRSIYKPDVLGGRALLDEALDELPDVALESLLLVGAGVLHQGVAGSVLGVQVLGGAGAQPALHGLRVGLGALLHCVLDSVLEAAGALVLPEKWIE